MSRLSLWKDGKHTNDYKFLDRRISEMFTLGGTGILCHKYLGVNAQGVQVTTTASSTSGTTILTVSDTSNIQLGDVITGTSVPTNSTVTAKTATTITLNKEITANIASGAPIGVSSLATKPSYINQSAQNIQDLLWQENRDRKYDTSIYKMRGIYQKQDQDFDLSQFGLFLQTGTIFMVFHLRDMVDLLGRKLMAGDVLELQHLKDYDALDQDVPAALKRYYVVGDCSFASEGFSPTWWPHLWRVKLNPLVDSQEYKDILNNIMAGEPGTSGENTPISQLMSTLNTALTINDAIITEAEQNVPKSGYNTDGLYDFPSDVALEQAVDTTSIQLQRPAAPIEAYLGGSGTAPNGVPMGAGIEFPTNPSFGDYFLRTDYMPNRVFRWDGSRWNKFNDVLRTNLTQGPNNQTLIGSFLNDTRTTTVGNLTVPERQSLSNALRPKADN